MIVESPVTMPREDTQRIMFGISDWDKKCHFSLKDEVYLYEKMNFKVNSWFIDMEEPNWRKKYQPSEQVLKCLKALRKEDDTSEGEIPLNASPDGNGNTWEAVFNAIATPGALTDPVKVIFQKDKTFNEPITAGTVIGIDSDLSFKSLTAQKVIFFGSRVEASSITAKHVMFLNSDINISSINTNNIYISGGNLNSKLICTNNCLIYFYLMLHNGKHKGIKKDKSYLFNINEIPYIKEHTINNFKKLLYDIISSHNLTDKNIFCSQIDDFTGVKKGNINIEYLHNCDKTWFLSNIDNYIFSNKVTSNKNSYLATIKLAQDSSMLDYMKHPELLKWFNDQLVDIQDLFFRTKGNPFLKQIVKDIFYQNVTEADILKMENNLENIQKRFSS